jgi:hypothetical protein
MPRNEIPILPAKVRRWECKYCNLKDVTREALPHTRMHNCPGMKGITVPMLEEEQRGKAEVRLKVREDYEGPDYKKTQKDEDGRSIMAVETVHDDGHIDLAVLATIACEAKITME